MDGWGATKEMAGFMCPTWLTWRKWREQVLSGSGVAKSYRGGGVCSLENVVNKIIHSSYLNTYYTYIIQIENVSKENLRQIV